MNKKQIKEVAYQMFLDGQNEAWDKYFDERFEEAWKEANK